MGIGLRGVGQALARRQGLLRTELRAPTVVERTIRTTWTPNRHHPLTLTQNNPPLLTKRDPPSAK